MPRMPVRKALVLLVTTAGLALGPRADAKAAHARQAAHHAKKTAKKTAKKPATRRVRTKPPVAHKGGAGNGTRVAPPHKPSITRVGSPSTDRPYPNPTGIPAISKGKE